MRRIAMLTLAGTLTGAAALDATPAPSLRGSPAAMVQQNRVAKEHGLDFYRTPAQIEAAVAAGTLVELRGNDDYAVADFVSHPYLQPEGKIFVERLAAQYREACGQRLVVTSAVRPTSGQPSNAHQLSVHPAGMAVDLRVSDRAECRSWLENTLLSLERRGVLNGIREFHPPHYHVAVFPGPYMAYLEERQAAEAELAAAAPAAQAPLATALADVAEASAIVARADAAPAAGASGLPAAAWAIALGLLVPVGIGVLRRR